MIRAIAADGRYQDESAAQRCSREVLIERRDAIGRTYLNAINPVSTSRLDADGTLTFENAAVMAGVGAEPAGGYVDSLGHVRQCDRQSPPRSARRRRPGSAGDGPGAAAVDGRRDRQVQIAAVNPVEPSWTVPVERVLPPRAEAAGRSSVSSGCRSVESPSDANARDGRYRPRRRHRVRARRHHDRARGCAKLEIKTEKDPGADFTAIRTYAWLPPAPMVSNVAPDAVTNPTLSQDAPRPAHHGGRDRELAARGLVRRRRATRPTSTSPTSPR